MISLPRRLTKLAERLFARLPDGVRRLIHHIRVRPGHYYSPYPKIADLEARADVVFATREALPGVDLRADAQADLLVELAPLAADLPWGPGPTAGLRYHYDNRPYSFGDGTFTALMLRHLRPSRYLEVGSGWSTALALDVRDRFVPGMSIRCVEPFPKRMWEALGESDTWSIDLIEEPVQEVDPAIVDELGSGDVLFIDSTHVAKAGSDVNLLVFEWLPRLGSGVYVHLHDIFDGFEYPKEWVLQGRVWTEAYLVRAFLQFNADFEVVAMTPWLHRHHPEWFRKWTPWVERNPGASIWLRRR